MSLGKTLHYEPAAEKCESLKLVVIGDFSAGKSSLINSILGSGACPIDTSPTTSAVTYFSHGSETTVAQGTDAGGWEYISDDEYRAYVQHGFSQDARSPKTGRLNHFRYRMPVARLKGIELVDTPGFQNPILGKTDTETTLAVAAKADALLIVADALKGNPTSYFMDYVKKVESPEHGAIPIWVFVNRADLKPPGELRTIRRSIEKMFKARAIPLESVFIGSALYLDPSTEVPTDVRAAASEYMVTMDEIDAIFEELRTRSVRRRMLSALVSRMACGGSTVAHETRVAGMVTFDGRGGDFERGLDVLRKSIAGHVIDYARTRMVPHCGAINWNPPSAFEHFMAFDRVRSSFDEFFSFFYPPGTLVSLGNIRAYVTGMVLLLEGKVADWNRQCASRAPRQSRTAPVLDEYILDAVDKFLRHAVDGFIDQLQDSDPSISRLRGRANSARARNFNGELKSEANEYSQLVKHVHGSRSRLLRMLVEREKSV